MASFQSHFHLSSLTVAPYRHQQQPLNNDRKVNLCLVCLDTASGYHYGVTTCEGCKAFFKRFLHNPAKEKVSYRCKMGNNCPINSRSRKWCMACRLKKCFDVGMSSKFIGCKVRRSQDIDTSKSIAVPKNPLKPRSFYMTQQNDHPSKTSDNRANYPFILPARDPNAPSPLTGHTIKAQQEQQKPFNNDKQVNLCLVCLDTASGYHYDVTTCEGCKAFFKRFLHSSAKGKVSYRCRMGNNCPINSRSRKCCMACRLKKCYAVGMSSKFTGCKVRRRQDDIDTSKSLVAPKNPIKQRSLYMIQQHDHPSKISENRANDLFILPARDRDAPSLLTGHSINAHSFSEHWSLLTEQFCYLINSHLDAIVDWSCNQLYFRDLPMKTRIRLLNKAWPALLILYWLRINLELIQITGMLKLNNQLRISAQDAFYLGAVCVFEGVMDFSRFSSNSEIDEECWSCLIKSVLVSESTSDTDREKETCHENKEEMMLEEAKRIAQSLVKTLQELKLSNQKHFSPLLIEMLEKSQQLEKEIYSEENEDIDIIVT